MDLSYRDPADAGSDLYRASYEAALKAVEAERRDQRPPRDDFSPVEVLEEIALVLADAARYLAAGTPGNALLRADDDAVVRDRAKEIRGPQHIASLFAGWLIDEAGRGTYEESVRAALAAAQDSPQERDLSRLLREYVGGILAGSIDFGHVLSRKRRAVAQSAPAARAAVDSCAIADAVGRLRKMFAQAGLSDISLDPPLAWRVFVRFASRPVHAAPPEVLAPQDGDLLLFEWGTQEHDGALRTFVAFTRQFASYGRSGERLEQLRCVFWFDQVTPPAGGLVWSGPDLPLREWVIGVEGTLGFSLLNTARAVAGKIEQELV